MDLNIILWLGGMLFSLGIFALKVGFGIAFGRLSRRQIGLILGGYLALFASTALLANRFLELAEPILKSGIYIHIAMSAGLALWGLVLLCSNCKAKERCDIGDLKVNIQDSKSLITKDKPKARKIGLKIPQSILLIMPCPVCITAIGISISSALTVLKAPPLMVGLAMGLFFAIFVGCAAALLRPKNEDSADIPLGLGMIGIALYFAGSLFIPQKIEEARLAYQSFSTNSTIIDTAHSTGVLVLFLAIFAAGFLLYRDNEDIS